MKQPRLFVAPLLVVLFALSASAQEQIDKADARAKGSALLAKLAVRVRVVRSVPEPEAVRVNWRRGGEGLGGTVTRGAFLAANQAADLPRGEWSGWLPLGTLCANTRGWDFPTIVVEAASPAKAKGKAQPAPLESVDVEFEFAEGGKVFHRFVEPSPKGATVGIAFPGSALGAQVSPEFVAQLNGLSTHARLRRERLEKHFTEPAPMPKQFALIGHLGGYGQFGTTGLGGPAGYGVRHCNPAILADECRTLRLLGVNSFVGSLRLADAAGAGPDFRKVYWGGPGSGSPINLLQKGGKLPDDGCPFDPALVPLMQASAAKAIEEHQAVGAQESWALWVDEIGVFAKEHLVRCDRCAGKFRDYLRAQKLSPGDFGKADWGDVQPFDLWGAPAETKPGTKAKGKAAAPPAPRYPLPAPLATTQTSMPIDAVRVAAAIIDRLSGGTGLAAGVTFSDTAAQKVDASRAALPGLDWRDTRLLQYAPVEYEPRLPPKGRLVAGQLVFADTLGRSATILFSVEYSIADEPIPVVGIEIAPIFSLDPALEVFAVDAETLRAFAGGRVRHAELLRIAREKGVPWHAGETPASTQIGRAHV